MVIANFDKGSTREDVFRIYQYAYGQILRIQGITLPTAVEVHFSLQNTGGEATTRIGVTKDGVTDVVIPDSLLENGDATQDYEIYAFVYLRNETSGQTEYKITLHITSRPKPEAFDRPEDAELFREAIKAVNESAARSAESEKQAEGWAHGREDLPERTQDNAKYYAGKTEKDAEKTATDRKEVERLVESVYGIDEQVTKVENLTKQAQTSATNAALSEQAAKESENNATQARAGAEVAEDNAELAAQRAEQDKAIVEQAKNIVKQMGQEVLDNKNLVDETAQDFDLKAQQALTDVNNAGQAQTERVQTAGNDAVESVKAAQGTATRAVEIAKTEAIEAVQTEGTTQAGNVAAEGEKQVQAVRGAAQEIMADRGQIQENKIGIAKLKEDKISYRVVGKIVVLPGTETKIACTNIAINTTELSMSEPGKTEQLTTTVTPSNTTDVISWKSSNVDVATVTNTGLVKAVGYGVAEITVTCGMQTAICHVNVKQTETEVVSDGVVIPDMYNTGIESNVVLQEVTPATISGATRLQMTQQIVDNYCDANGVVKNYHFNGIYVDFNKSITQTVTFRNCKFTGDGNMTYAVAVSAYGIDKGIIFENCEFSHYKSAVVSGTWKVTFDKCYVHDMMQDAFKINRSDVYLKNSYVHSLGIDTTSHADGVQIENNDAEVTVHIYNCRFDQPHTSSNTENAAIFAKCKGTNIILDVQKCHATGGNYTIYALDGETAKVSGKVECVVGCSSRYGIANIADSVEQNVVSAGSLLVSTVQNGKLYATNYTNKERTLKIVTDIEEKTVTIPKSSTYDENHAQEFSMYPFNVLVEYLAGAKWVKCYENDNLIRTQKLGE